MKLRTYVPTLPPRAPYISEAEVFERTLTAIRTLKAMPDRERRFLASGTKAAWPATLVEWSDLLAREGNDPKKDFKPGVRIYRRDIPIEPFMDIVDAKGEIPPRDDDDRRERDDPTRKEISDSLIAGAWFAKLALLPENIDEFERCVEQYRTGSSKSPQVADQRILTLHAQGWGPRLIGMKFGLNSDQIEKRIYQISRELFRIANGTARYADLYRIQKLSREGVTV